MSLKKMAAYTTGALALGATVLAHTPDPSYEYPHPLEKASGDLRTDTRTQMAWLNQAMLRLYGQKIKNSEGELHAGEFVDVPMTSTYMQVMVGAPGNYDKSVRFVTWLPQAAEEAKKGEKLVEISDPDVSCVFMVDELTRTNKKWPGYGYNGYDIKNQSSAGDDRCDGVVDDATYWREPNHAQDGYTSGIQELTEAAQRIEDEHLRNKRSTLNWILSR